MTSIIPVNAVFGESIVDPSGIISDKPTKDTSTVQIIKPSSGQSENPNIYPSHVLRKFKNIKPRNMLMEYPSGYPTGDTSTMPTENLSSMPRYHPI